MVCTMDYSYTWCSWFKYFRTMYTMQAKDNKEDNNVSISNIEEETAHDNTILSDTDPDNWYISWIYVESITTQTSTDTN